MVELSITLTRDAEVSGGVKAWVVNVGAQAANRMKPLRRLRFPGPEHRDGGPSSRSTPVVYQRNNRIVCIHLHRPNFEVHSKRQLATDSALVFS